MQSINALSKGFRPSSSQTSSPRESFHTLNLLAQAAAMEPPDQFLPSSANRHRDTTPTRPTSTDTASQSPVTTAQLKQAIRAFSNRQTDDSPKQLLAMLQNPRLKPETALEQCDRLLPRHGTALIHQAAERGYISLVKALLQRGINPNSTRDTLACTPLHYAAERGKKLTAITLLGNGASIDQQDRKGMTALHYATDAEQTSMVKYLLRKGANPNIGNQQGCQPLHYAAENKNPELIKLLLEHGASIDVQDKDGMTPLHYAANANEIAITTLLLAHQADPNIPDKDQQTPLHYATQSSNYELMERLLANKADKALEDNTGKTAISYALDHKDSRALDILLFNDTATRRAAKRKGL